jgi:hypothetical protein
MQERNASAIYFLNNPPKEHPIFSYRTEPKEAAKNLPMEMVF